MHSPHAFNNNESKQVQQMVRPPHSRHLHMMESVWDYVMRQKTLRRSKSSYWRTDASSSRCFDQVCILKQTSRRSDVAHTVCTHAYRHSALGFILIVKQARKINPNWICNVMENCSILYLKKQNKKKAMCQGSIVF